MAEGTPDVKEARRMLAKGICIAGVGETEQGIISDRGSFELLAEVTKTALDDAGLEQGNHGLARDPVGGGGVGQREGRGRKFVEAEHGRADAGRPGCFDHDDV